jgi:hypothetical protein
MVPGSLFPGGKSGTRTNFETLWLKKILDERYRFKRTEQYVTPPS